MANSDAASTCCLCGRAEELTASGICLDCHVAGRRADTYDQHAAESRACEDCGDPTPYRRHRCPACLKLVCHWCFGHVHNRTERAS